MYKKEKQRTIIKKKKKEFANTHTLRTTKTMEKKKDETRKQKEIQNTKTQSLG